MNKTKTFNLDNTFLKNILGGKGAIKKLLASATAVLNLLSANVGALGADLAAPKQPASMISYKKSQIDEYEDILSEIRNMPDKEVEEKVTQARKKYLKLWHRYYEDMEYFYMSYEDKFDYENAPNKDLALDRQSLAIYMHLDAFMRKYPEYFKSFPDNFFSEMIYTQNLSDTETLNKIEEEKEKFKKLGTFEGKEYFEIEDKIESSVNPKSFLLIIRRINGILEKYGKLREKIIPTLKRDNAIFRISSFDSDQDELLNRALMYTSYRYRPQETPHSVVIDVFISKNFLSSVEYISKVKLVSILTGYNSYAENNELISSLVAHEMGHVFVFSLLSIALDIAYKDELSESFQYVNFEDKMKEKIIKIAKEKYGATDSKISQYAETDSPEWIAEVFANLECANEENISPYGKAMSDVIKMFEDETITNEELLDLVS